MTTLGLVSGLFTTLSFLPQVLRTVRTGSAGDLSLGWLGLFGAGVFGWFVYGLLSADIAISLTNAVTLCLVGLLTALKLATLRGAES